MKNKDIDFFWMLLGMAFLIMGFVFFVIKKDWFMAVVNIILGFIFIVKSCYNK